MAAALANANVGTPLNPNLTTQQLWDQFYLIVRQPESDIESIITNQLMKFLFAPPAPGGVGANHEVIYNNNGVLAGDPKFLWDDALNKLDIDGSATISGDLTVRTNQLAVTSTGVGVGTASPTSGTLSLSSNFLFFSDSQTKIGDNGLVNGTASDGNTQIQYFGGKSLFFNEGAANRMTLNSTGLNVANGNVILGTSGKGIDFSATPQPAGMTSELLNDYEEGTFVPTIAGTTSAGTGTYTTQIGRYTKIGRVVTVDINITWTAHTGTGGLEIDGLPFSVLNTTGYSASASIGYFDNIALTAGNVPLFVLWWFNTNKIRGNQIPTGGGAVAGMNMDSAGQIALSVTYIVA
jgi:hypothetical protein